MYKIELAMWRDAGGVGEELLTRAAPEEEKEHRTVRKADTRRPIRQ